MRGSGGSCVAKESTCAKGLGKRSPGHEGQVDKMSVERWLRAWWQDLMGIFKISTFVLISGRKRGREG